MSAWAAWRQNRDRYRYRGRYRYRYRYVKPPTPDLDARQHCVWVCCERPPICCDLCQNNCVEPCQRFLWDFSLKRSNCRQYLQYMHQRRFISSSNQVNFMFRIPNPFKNNLNLINRLYTVYMLVENWKKSLYRYYFVFQEQFMQL